MFVWFGLNVSTSMYIFYVIKDQQKWILELKDRYLKMKSGTGSDLVSNVFVNICRAKSFSNNFSDLVTAF